MASIPERCLKCPVDDLAFDRAVMKTKGKLEAERRSFSILCENLRQKFLKRTLEQASTREGAIDFFKNRLRRTIALHGSALLARSMGEIVRQYGIIGRDFNYADKLVFPIYQVRGMKLSYQMQGGLSTELDVEWDVVKLRR